MSVKIQIRGDTAANWTSVNPILSIREPGIETDTKYVKYGDGVTPWNSLPYSTFIGVTSLSTAISSTNSSVNSLSASVSTALPVLSTIDSQITSLSTSTSTAISSLSTSVGSVGTGLSTTSSRVTSLSTSSSTIASSLSTGLSSTNSVVASLSTVLSSGGGGGGGASDYLNILSNSEIPITSASTATIGRQHLISGTSADYSVTLPTASGNTGKFVGIRISNSATKLFSITGASGQLINGLNTRLMWAGESAVLYCDGTGWQKISGKTLPMICQMSLSSTQFNLFPSNNSIVVPINAVNIDNTGSMASTSNNRILIKRAGKYSISGVVVYDAFTSAASRALTQLRKNGASLCNSEGSAVVGTYASPFATTLFDAAVNDYMQLVGFQNSAASQSCNGSTLYITTMIVVTEILGW